MKTKLYLRYQQHSQDLDRALDFIDTSADIGCSAVKFQLFRIKELFAEQALLAKLDASKGSMGIAI